MLSALMSMRDLRSLEVKKRGMKGEGCFPTGFPGARSVAFATESDDLRVLDLLQSVAIELPSASHQRHGIASYRVAYRDV